jgi:glycosyltransferase involved in cell wall biosynthesis
MQISVIIITKNEQPRLRLCLASLGRQTVRWEEEAEVIVVDDGSAVPVGPGEVPPGAPQPRVLRQDVSQGRSASRNAGAAVARGQRLLFLDGDVLLSPEALARHGALGPDEMGRGEQRHLRGTRFFSDPRTGTPWPGKEAKVRSMGDLTPHLVTEDLIANAPFERLLARSEAAIYPGAAPRRLYDLEMGSLRARSAPLAEWMAAAGHNFSIAREAFLEAGGFDRDISINEHRELALRLCRRGARVVVVEGAVSVHLTHREGWRDPLTGEDRWEEAFARRHPLETELMLRLWRSLAGDATLEPAQRLMTLEEVDALLRPRPHVAAALEPA